MLRFFTDDVFLKKYAVYFSGSMVVAVLNYAFHPLLGRFLTPSDFGEIQALLSLVAQSGIIFGTFSVVAINVTANLEDKVKRNAILFELQKISLWIVGVVTVIFFLFLAKVQTFFNFSSVYILIALAVMWPISALAIFRNAYLQGSGDFFHLNNSQLLSAGSRLVLSVSLTAIGMEMFGAILGIVIANVLFLVYLIYHTYLDFPFQIKSSLETLKAGSIKNELYYGVLVLLGTALVTLFYTSDVLIVKRFFTPEETGLYSGISAIAKILFFVIGPVSAVLISSIKLKNTFSENSSYLFKALTIAVLIGSACLCTFFVFHDIIVALMLGKAYVSYSYYLPKVSVVMFLAAIANIFILYFLALRRFILILVSMIGIASLAYGLIFEHRTIDALLNNFIYSLTTLIFILVLLYGKDYLNHRSCIQ
jgi:O-antigen/teichoic acid export membrane protein